MTIFEPISENISINKIITGLVLGIVLGLGTGVYLYSQVVHLRSTIEKSEKEFTSLEERNAELRNTIYITLDSERMLQTARAMGFVADGNPLYLEPKPSKLASEL
ncbi:MAG: hypothetical protein COU08_04285 [Candidatus Harrisonbacteria bacterium CG10_big_fil_rev_8_21_14_0_10_42_17]|uniref:Cell division protein FtsL n=1 Tax=Candidatus Harrisonbacteria bacterium CG10_big_fil_rev_8_21_14_0_10_42_17 TaxID=1974584 RepID=A0A2M6WH45_9BACT|nr:MAG: hypothetical protein COU08_04285 [Candidatus Harrisonbacteria bacterium CG10_big_fil_rev_8_21_14_0_10_42_17]